MAGPDIYEYRAPSSWAPYLINGDASGLEDAERARADAFMAWVGAGAPVSCEDAGFVHHHDAWAFCPLSADCQVYTFLKHR